METIEITRIINKRRNLIKTLICEEKYKKALEYINESKGYFKKLGIVADSEQYKIAHRLVELELLILNRKAYDKYFLEYINNEFNYLDKEDLSKLWLRINNVSTDTNERKIIDAIIGKVYKKIRSKVDNKNEAYRCLKLLEKKCNTKLKDLYRRYYYEMNDLLSVNVESEAVLKQLIEEMVLLASKVINIVIEPKSDVEGIELERVVVNIKNDDISYIEKDCNDILILNGKTNNEMISYLSDKGISKAKWYKFRNTFNDIVTKEFALKLVFLLRLNSEQAIEFLGFLGVGLSDILQVDIIAKKSLDIGLDYDDYISVIKNLEKSKMERLFKNYDKIEMDNVTRKEYFEYKYKQYKVKNN